MSDDLQVLIDIWAHPGYQAGLVSGLLGVALVLAIALILRRRVYGWGLILAIGVVVALTRRTELETDLLVRLTVLAAAGLLVDLTTIARWRWRWVLTMAGWAVVAVAAIWFGAAIGVTEPEWVRWGLPLTVVGFGAGLWAWGRLPDVELVGILSLIAFAGAWVTIPETDLFVVLLGAALPMGLVTLWPLSARPSAAGALALGGVFSWLVLSGGIPRPWTVVAAWATVAAIPTMAAIIHWNLGRPRKVYIVLIHLLYVAVVTRVANFTDHALVVLGWSVAALIAVTLALLLLPERQATGPAGGL